MSSPNPFASFAQSVDVGGVTLSLGGDISGIEFLFGWDDALAPNAGPAGAGVRVRQISAILNIGIAMSNSGSNTAISLVSGANTTTSSDVQALISTLAATELGASANGSALARISSGDASAIGSDAVVKICQAFQDALTLRGHAAATVDPVDPGVIPGDVSAMAAVPAAGPRVCACGCAGGRTQHQQRPARDSDDAVAAVHRQQPAGVAADGDRAHRCRRRVGPPTRPGNRRPPACREVVRPLSAVRS